MKNDMRGIFNDIHAGRQADKLRALRNAAKFQVRSLKKNGEPYLKQDPTWFYTTREAAEAKMADMQKMNPGFKFDVVEL